MNSDDIYYNKFIIKKMSNNDYTVRKEHYKTNSNKSQFSFAQPVEDPTAIKQGLIQSRHTEMVRNNRIDLFGEMKQNVGMGALMNKLYTKQYVEQIRVEQRGQTDKLLLEISKLHSLLQDQQRSHRHATQRMKQQSQQISLLRISNLKQSQFSQIQVLQLQLKKIKQVLQEKIIMYENLQKITTRKIQILVTENQKLKDDLKEMIQKKNMEIFDLKDLYTRENVNLVKSKDEQIEEYKNLAEKELKKVYRKLEQREKSMEYIQEQHKNMIRENYQLQSNYERERSELNEKIQLMVEEEKQRYHLFADNLKRYHEAQNQQNYQRIQRQKQTIDIQLQNLVSILHIRDDESKRNLITREAERIDMKLQLKGISEQNQYLKKLVQQIKLQQIQQIQFLKVKMGVLHKNDIEALVQLYEARIQGIAKQLQFAEKEVERINVDMKKQREKMYELKKKYDFTISVLHEERSQLKLGMGHFQKDMKQKLQNQRSMMIMTSRNFIKQNQLKNQNIKFYEDERRKLRQLLDIQAQEVEQSQKNVEEKIKLAEDELSRLSNKIIEVKSDAEETQKKLKITIQQKNVEIKRLNNMLNEANVMNKQDNQQQIQEIKRLDEELRKKDDEIKNCQVKCNDLVRELKIIKDQNQKLMLENQINSEEAKQQYKKISDKNISELKQFYQRKLQQLQNTKKQLEKLNSSQSEQITELIIKYKELQLGMKQLLKQTKKRGDLENRIINLGMDNNLVKNMNELLHK